MMSHKIFTNCPSCLSKVIEFDGQKKYTCPECGWTYYQNTAAAVGVLLEYEGKVLVVTRNREPGKGMLDLPGGFVDPNESAEEAVGREICEELGVVFENLKYLCSAPNTYPYKGIEYSTCDIFFTARLTSINFSVQKSEIAGYKWIDPDDLQPEKFAFESMKMAIKVYLNKRYEIRDMRQ
jgi:NAD+ diphosphatase